MCSVSYKGKQPNACVYTGDEKEEQWLLLSQGNTGVTVGVEI